MTTTMRPQPQVRRPRSFGEVDLTRLRENLKRGRTLAVNQEGEVNTRGEGIRVERRRFAGPLWPVRDDRLADREGS
jgi:hypothetical protein